MTSFRISSSSNMTTVFLRKVSKSKSVYMYGSRSFSVLSGGDKTKPSWIDSSFIPVASKPYLRLMRADKQTGTLLLLWPCFWSISLATPLHQFPDPIIAAKFALGAVLMRSAGCVINDFWDKEYDKHVERTKDRPLASGELSVTQAGGCLFGLLSMSLGVLLSMNQNSILLGFASMPLVVAYPLMKRYTYFPQAVLGMTFNWGALIGWCEVMGSPSLIHTLPLYVGGICWTLLYDTIYGYQDRDDDAKLGLKSTALYFGDKPQIPFILFGSGTCLGILSSGYFCDLTSPFYYGMILVGGHFAWQIATLDITSKKNLWDRFSSNHHVGALVTASIIAGHF